MLTSERRVRPRLLALEDRAVPASNLNQFAVGADAGFAPYVSTYNADGSVHLQFSAYDSLFHGGVHVAMGKVNGDAIPDLVTGPGPGGGPHVRVFDGATGKLLSEWFAYDAKFTGGVNVAVGDVTGDGAADVVTGAGPGGGPHVRVFNAMTGAPEGEFFAYDAHFSGGVFVAAGDVTGGVAENIVTGAGPGGGPHVRVFDSSAGHLFDEFFAYDPGFAGGVTVAAGDVTGDGAADVITGPASAGGPHVRVWGARGLLLSEFMAYPADFSGGVRVTTADVTNDGQPEVLVGNGPGRTSTVRAFNAFEDVALLKEFAVFDPSFTGGVFVG